MTMGCNTSKSTEISLPSSPIEPRVTTDPEFEKPLTQDDFHEDIKLKILTLHDEKKIIKREVKEFRRKARKAAEDEDTELARKYTYLELALAHQIQSYTEAEHTLDEIRANARIIESSARTAQIVADAAKQAEKLNLRIKAEDAQSNLYSLKHIMGELHVDVRVVTRVRKDVLDDIDAVRPSPPKNYGGMPSISPVSEQDSLTMLPIEHTVSPNDSLAMSPKHTLSQQDSGGRSSTHSFVRQGSSGWTTITSAHRKQMADKILIDIFDSVVKDVEMDVAKTDADVEQAQHYNNDLKEMVEGTFRS